MDDKEIEQPSIVERIKSAGETLGVSRGELMSEITRLYKQGGTEKMKELFEAYKDWEVRERPSGSSEEQAEETAMRNLDLMAGIADNISRTDGGMEEALWMAATWEVVPPGPVVNFYREAVGYSPPPTQ